MTHTVRLRYSAAIPVGHRVEVTHYELPMRSGRRGRAQSASSSAGPAVLDLDTGIRYVEHWHVLAAPPNSRFEIDAFELQPLPGLHISSVVRGRVLACVVVTVTKHVGLPVQTVLVIEPVL